MLKRLSVFTLLLILSVQCFHKGFVVLDFYWNQSYIAKVLCENKDKPKLKCGGKCQLMKQLKKEEKKEQQLPNLKWDGKEQVLSSKSFFATIVSFNTHQKNLYSPYLIRRLPTYYSFIFHPPGLAC